MEIENENHARSPRLSLHLKIPLPVRCPISRIGTSTMRGIPRIILHPVCLLPPFSGVRRTTSFSPLPRGGVHTLIVIRMRATALPVYRDAVRNGLGGCFH